MFSNFSRCQLLRLISFTVAGGAVVGSVPLVGHFFVNKNATAFFSTILFCLLWLISISVHEFGHAIVAYWGGDKSVKAKGYLSFNPFNYTHPLTSIILPVFFFLFGGLPLPGGAIYIDSQQLRSRLWQSAAIAAGPFASLLLTPLLVVLYYVSPAWNLPYWFSATLSFFILIHLIFILFNLIPVPPLDGYGIIEPWLPHQLQDQMRKFTFLWLFFLFVLLPFTSSFTLLFSSSVYPLFSKLGVSGVLAAWHGSELFNRWYCVLVLVAVGVFALIRQPQAAWNFLGDILSKFKKYELALTAYNKALTLKPGIAQNWYQRDWVLRILGRYDEALINYNKAVELIPNNADLWHERGWLLAQSLQRYEDALRSFDRAIQIDLNYYDAWNGRGWALSELQMHKEAIAAYDKAIQINPDYYLAWHNRGSALKALQQYEKAFESYDKALEIDPEHYYAFYGLYGRGWALHNLQRFKEAITSFDKATELKPNSDYVWYSKGRSYALQNNITQAVKNLQRAIELNPHKSRALAKADSAFAKIRKDERFKQLIEEQDLEY